MLNVVAIMGRLVSDPQLRQTNTGKSVASLRIACDRVRRDANGQMQADFFDVTAWDRTAEFICRYFHKGEMIAVDGRLQSRSYQDKNGNNRTAIEIVANNANFVGSKGSGNSGSPAPQEYARPAAVEAAPSYSVGSNEDFSVIDADSEDLPF